MTTTKFAYVQIGAKDYKRLADFYIKALGFTLSASQEWLCGKEGICLSAPGYAQGDAPVFGFVPAVNGETAAINDAGFAHTCFETNDVKAAVRQLLKCGGSVHSTMKSPEIHPCVYCKDPEGNVVEFHIPFPSGKGVGELLNTASCLLGLKPEKGMRAGNAKDALKFIHVNIICADWQKLCNFYNTVFQCSNIGKLKDHQGGYKEQVIGVPNVHVVGQHILMPGFEESYPTLEIFTYSVPGRSVPCDETALGINCIGFACDNAENTAQAIVNAGGCINDTKDGYILAGDIQNGRIMLR
jgi:predicted enzyme related to lactoylglutathione lyase